MSDSNSLTWSGVVRLGLVQAAIGAVVVLLTSTLNRVMIVELGLAATIPGALVAFHFAVQFLSRPRMGYNSDRSTRRNGVIMAGLLLLAGSGTVATVAVALAQTQRLAGLLLATIAFAGIGIGVSAAGTPLLALLAQRVAAERRARAAAIVWLMMIAGAVVTTVVASQLLEPFSFVRLIGVSGGVGGVATLIAWVALAGVEEGSSDQAEPCIAPVAFREAVRRAWCQPSVRRFAAFIFVAMLGYSAQDLILEPFAGVVFGLSPAESTRISSVHQAGMLLGMIAAALMAVRLGGLAVWARAGCAASALAFSLLAATPSVGSVVLLKASVFSLGLANGAFAIGAVGSMMIRAKGDDAGLLMGIFGAAQAVAYAIGGFFGAAGSDLAKVLLGSAVDGYTAVFVAEAVLFVIAALLVRVDARPLPRPKVASPEAGDGLLAVLR